MIDLEINVFELDGFEPKGFVTDNGYVGYIPSSKYRGILFDTEQEYVDWIRELKDRFRIEPKSREDILKEFDVQSFN